MGLCVALLLFSLHPTSFLLPSSICSSTTHSPSCFPYSRLHLKLFPPSLLYNDFFAMIISLFYSLQKSPITLVEENYSFLSFWCHNIFFSWTVVSKESVYVTLIYSEWFCNWHFFKMNETKTHTHTKKKHSIAWRMTCITLIQEAYTHAAWVPGSYSFGIEKNCEAVEHTDSEHRGEQVKVTARKEVERGVFFTLITRPCLYDASRVAFHIDLPLL